MPNNLSFGSVRLDVSCLSHRSIDHNQTVSPVDQSRLLPECNIRLNLSYKF